MQVTLLSMASRLTVAGPCVTLPLGQENVVLELAGETAPQPAGLHRELAKNDGFNKERAT